MSKCPATPPGDRVMPNATMETPKSRRISHSGMTVPTPPRIMNSRDSPWSAQRKERTVALWHELLALNREKDATPRVETPRRTVKEGTSLESIKTLRKVTIDMSDLGAELTLQDATLHTPASTSSLSLPEASNEEAEPSIQSLLDVELTPSRVHSMPPSRFEPECSFPLACCGPTTAVSDGSLSSCPTISQCLVQNKITLLLGEGTDPSFCGWQAWSLSLLLGWPAWEPSRNQDDDDDDDDATIGTSQQVVADRIRRALRNRVFDLDSRRRRLQQIRKDLFPFQDYDSSSPKRHHFNRAEGGPPGLSAINSFATPSHSPFTNRSFDQRDEPRRKSVAPFSFWDSLRGCTNSRVVSPSPIRIRNWHVTHLNDEGYDSDPEEYACTRSVDSTTTAELGSLLTYATPLPRTLSERSTTSRWQPSGPPSATEQLQVIREFMNERLTLIQHYVDQQKDSDQQARALDGSRPGTAPSCAVSMWIEPGQRLRDRFLSPKLAWKVMHQVEERDSAESRRASKRQQSGLTKKALSPVTFEPPHSLDLLDIVRIVDVDGVDRTRHPFLKCPHAFRIRTVQDQSLVFEARSAMEQVRIVRSLKLLVARLGSKLVVHDETVLDEFFVGGSIHATDEDDEEKDVSLKPHWLRRRR
jgi:hypothetical protein